MIRHALAIAGARTTLYERALLAFLAASMPMSEADALARAYLDKVTEFSKKEHAPAEEMWAETVAQQTKRSLKLTGTPDHPHGTPS